MGYNGRNNNFSGQVKTTQAPARSAGAASKPATASGGHPTGRGGSRPSYKGNSSARTYTLKDDPNRVMFGTEHGVKESKSGPYIRNVTVFGVEGVDMGVSDNDTMKVLIGGEPIEATPLTPRYHEYPERTVTYYITDNLIPGFSAIIKWGTGKRGVWMSVTKYKELATDEGAGNFSTTNNTETEGTEGESSSDDLPF